MQHQDITSIIISAALDVHKALGPGLLESAYKACLIMEFAERGLCYKYEMPAPLIYKDKKLDCGFRIDFLVEDKVIIELKSVETLTPLHEAQLLTYLRLLEKQVGLLINFNVPILKNGIKRCVLHPQEKVPF